MRIWKALIAVSLVLAVPLRAQQYGEKQEVATSIGRIGLTVTNIGVIGNSYRGPFVFGVPSCEYPIGSGIEHLFDGGLWVGSVVRGQPLVSTGAAGDDANGYDPGNAGYEFTRLTGIQERSSLFDAQYYNPLAISHQGIYEWGKDVEAMESEAAEGPERYRHPGDGGCWRKHSGWLRGW